MKTYDAPCEALSREHADRRLAGGCRYGAQAPGKDGMPASSGIRVLRKGLRLS